jgi:hypothetical protein
LAANAAPVDETTVLTQKCQAIGGIYTVYLGRNSLRIDSPGVIIFSQGPKWTITVLNPKKKIYYQSDYKVCLKLIKAARTPFSSIADSSALTWRKARGANIAGLSSDQWCNDSLGKGKFTSSIKCWTLPEAQFAPQCAEIMDSFYGIPPTGHGLPLRFFYTGTENSLLPMPARQYDADGLRQQEYGWLDTTAIKKIPASAALYVIPKECKPTKNYGQLAVEGNIDTGSAEFILKDLRKHPEALFNSR